MQIQVKVNDSKIYDLCSWDAITFEQTQVLSLQTSDLQSVKEDFKDISKIDIYKDDELVATYTVFNTYSNIVYLGEIFVQHENKFADALDVTLTKRNLVEQVEKLNEQLNPIIDIDAMDVEEYRDYMLQQVSKAGNKDICAGDYVQISLGRQFFTYKYYDDQLTLLSIFCVCQEIKGMGIDMSLLSLPYHSPGNPCQLYPAFDLITIFGTLFLRSVKIQTYCNEINMLFSSASSKEEISGYVYGMELPEKSQATVDEIVKQATTIMLAILVQYQTGNSDQPSDGSESDGTENTEEGEGNEEVQPLA